MNDSHNSAIAGVALSSDVLRLWARRRKQEAADLLLAGDPDDVRSASARIAEFAFQVVLRACGGDAALAVQFVDISLEHADPMDLADVILTKTGV